jgi:hypothetical protein
VFELCLVGVMVIFELLGHRAAEEAAQPVHAPWWYCSRRQHSWRDRHRKKQMIIANAGPRAKARVSASRLVRTFFKDHVQPASATRVEMKALTGGIRAFGISIGAAACEDARRGNRNDGDVIQSHRYSSMAPGGGQGRCVSPP